MRTHLANAITVAVLVAVAGCGPGGREPQDVDAPPADASFDASDPGILGEVGGETIRPDTSYWVDSPGDDYVILMEGGIRCQAGTASGQAVGLFFYCGAGDVGTYRVEPSNTGDCTGGPFAVVSVSGTPFYSQWARTGSIEITARSSTGIEGTVVAGQFFNGDFPNIPGSLNGTFAADRCP